MGHERSRKKNSRRNKFNPRIKFQRFGWFKDCGVYCYEHQGFSGSVIRGIDNKGRAIFSFSVDSDLHTGYVGSRLSLEEAFVAVELAVAKKCKGGLI